MKMVSVFGGAETNPGEALYQEAYQLGVILGKAGYTVLNGGYIGVMEAVSRGAFETGGHVIGITCDEIEAWRPIKPNPWIHEEYRFPTIRQRLFALIDRCDAAIVFPGGIGTLGELAVMWSQLQIGAITPRPLIILGSDWKNTLEAFFQYLGRYVNQQHRHWLIFCNDINEAFAILENNSLKEKPE
jgi:uncharacterized protein (TIGR00730 family)